VNGSDSAGADVTPESRRASDALAGTVAARAAVEPATRNSRRDGFFSDINKDGYGCGKVNTEQMNRAVPRRFNDNSELDLD
jgi:hypothetical protein